MGYYELVKDILTHEVFLQTHHFPHHAGLSVLEHAIHVSHTTYLWAKKFKMPLEGVTRGALLHDFYLYDWHKRREDDPRRFQLHGFRHPKVALDHANRYFSLTPIEASIIYKHMWPLTLFRVPRKREELLVTVVDKYCSIIEVLSRKRRAAIQNLTHEMINGHDPLGR